VVKEVMKGKAFVPRVVEMCSVTETAEVR